MTRDWLHVTLLHCRPRPVFTVSVAKKSSVVAAHVLPLSCAEEADWSLEAEAKYIRG